MFVPCHCHDERSNFRGRDALVRTTELIDYAHELGHKGVAITNHETISSSLKANKYITSKKEYEVRFVALMLMSYYLEDKYINIAFEIINKLYLVDYYSKMGVAWFLATAAINYPDLVYNYLDYSKDIELKRMTVRKLRDSFRIDDKYKEIILKTIRS